MLSYRAEPMDSTQLAPTRTLLPNLRRPIWAWPPEAMAGTTRRRHRLLLGVRATQGAPSRAYKAIKPRPRAPRALASLAAAILPAMLKAA
jgi:hypothetical protein